VLVPADPGFTIASDLACEVVSTDMEGALHCQADGVRYGDPDLALEFKQLGGNFELDSANRGLLGGLLPTLVHIQPAQSLRSHRSRISSGRPQRADQKL